MNVITISSLLTSLAGLVAIYFAASGAELEVVDLSDITPEFVGRTIATGGVIKSHTVHEDGHIFLTIQDGGKTLQVPVFYSLAQHLDISKFKDGTRIKVAGLVDEYRGSVQVVPRKLEDLRLDD